ncbi:MAG: N-formylglutamate amidohydrolase [Alphaproteobacteria bacterium]|nr:N-formylglutamate amidohydrolase [Alphaproteobacteria bacterium]
MTERLEPDTPLLGPDEPAAFEVINGQAGGRVLLLCDHASNRVPAALDGLGLSEIELARHIGWDIGAEDVTRRLADALDAPAVIAGYSRLVIDCNRDLDHPQLILPESDGTPVPANIGLSEDGRAARIGSLFDPYHAAIEAELARLKQGLPPEQAPVLLSIHSFTPIMDGQERPWEIGILWNRDPRLPEPLIARLRENTDLTVGDNEPYSARLGYGYTLERHGDGAGFANALIEIRQDLIDTHHGAEAWTGILLAAFRDVLGDESLYRVRKERETVDG